jgi:hypothetical protein
MLLSLGNVLSPVQGTNSGLVTASIVFPPTILLSTHLPTLVSLQTAPNPQRKTLYSYHIPKKGLTLLLRSWRQRVPSKCR